jgi:hypothetical protein
MEKGLSGDFKQFIRTLRMSDTLKDFCVAASRRNINLSNEDPSYLRSPRPAPPPCKVRSA